MHLCWKLQVAHSTYSTNAKAKLSMFSLSRLVVGSSSARTPHFTQNVSARARRIINDVRTWGQTKLHHHKQLETHLLNLSLLHIWYCFFYKKKHRFIWMYMQDTSPEYKQSTPHKSTSMLFYYTLHIIYCNMAAPWQTQTRLPWWFIMVISPPMFF